jgi:hypothetical protein
VRTVCGSALNTCTHYVRFKSHAFSVDGGGVVPKISKIDLELL